jgi:hypothetical protein
VSCLEACANAPPIAKELRTHRPHSADSGAFLHPIDGLSRPGILVPGSVGCTLIATSANGSLLALGSRTKVQVLAWNGDGAGGLAAATAPPARGGAAAAAAVIEALFTVLLDKPIGAGAAAAELAASSANRDRSAGSTGFLGFSSSKQPQAAGGATTVCVTRLTWMGGLLSVGVVHRSSTSLGDGEDEVHATDATGAGLDGSAGFVGSRADTEHCLTYLLIQPWTGQVMREVRAGPAPPLDVTGLLTIPAGLTEPPGLAGAGSALLSLLSPGGPSVPVGPPGAAKSLPATWGAAVLVEALNEEEGLAAAAAKPRTPPTDAATHTLDTPLGHALHAGREAGAASALPDGSASDALSAHFEEGQGRNVAGRLLIAAIRTGASGDSDAAGAACVGTCLTALGGSAGGSPSFAFDSPPLDFYRCGSLPYVLTAMAGGVSVHNVHTGEQVQFLKVPGVLGMVVCPRAAEAARAMHRAAQAASLADPTAIVGSDTGDEAGVGSSTGGQGEAVAAEAETLYVVARTGLLTVRSLPLQMQLAALLSRRPPMLDTALALCEHARGIVAVASRSGCRKGENIAATSAETLVRREAGLRATLGYTLCSGGDYPSGMRLLLLAQEPVCNVLALFPQLATALDVAGGSVGGTPELELPSSAQAVTDEELPTALPSLIAYLERQRAMCYAAIDVEAAAAAAAASAATIASVSAFVGVTDALHAEDAAPASTRAALAVSIDEALLVALLADARCAEEGPARDGATDGGQSVAASRRARAVSLLAARNAVRCTSGEALLAAYGRTGSPLGCSELVALYHGKGMVERVVSVLAGSAEAAVHAGDAVGLPLSSATWSEASELDGPMGPVVHHVRVLSAYLRRLGGRTHEGLVLATVARMLGGSTGRIGVMLGLSVLMPPMNWLGRSKAAPDAPFAPLNPVRTLAMLKSLDVDVDHVQLWGLRGDTLLASGQEEGGSAAALLSRLLASEGGESALTRSLWPSLAPAAPAPEGEAAGGEEEAAAEGHAGILSLDLRILPPPAAGWGRHFVIAYIEYLLAAFLSPAAADAPMPPGSVQELALAYVSVLHEAAMQLDARPAARLEEETGLMREFRARLCGLLTLVRTKGLTLDAAAVLAAIATVPLHQERVLLLRLLGRDDEALGVLLWQLQDFAGADAYCASVWSERAGGGGGSGGGGLLAQEDTSSVYSALLRTYLTPVEGEGAGREAAVAVVEAPAPPVVEAVLPALRGHSPRGAPVFTPVSEESEDCEEEEGSAAASPAATGDSASTYPHLNAMLLDRRLLPCPVETGAEGSAPHPVTVNRVMSILTRNPDRVRPVDALTLLPPALSLAAVLPFVEAASRHGSDALRTLVVARAFAGVAATRSQGALTARQSQGTTVEKISTCDTCGRRLAAGGRPAPFVYHPNGRVTHVTCTGPVKTGKEEGGKGGRTVRGGVK